MLLALAWKNIWRNRKRSLIIVAAIAFGLWGSLLSGGVMMGMGESMVNNAIDRDLCHIQIHDTTYSREKEIHNTIGEAGRVIDTIETIPGVQSVSARTIIMGMASSPASSFGVRIVGIDPEAEAQTTSIHRSIREGSYLDTDRRNPIVIGEKLSRRLNIKLRSKVVLSFQGLDESIVDIACRVTGIYRTESSRFDEMNVYVLQNDLFRVLNTVPVYHEIAVRTETSKRMSGVYSALAALYPDLDVRTWQQLAPELAYMSEIMKSFTVLFVVIILFALIFGITNTMLMSVVERTRELGILMAVGMKKSRIFIMILGETVFLSLTGGAAGILMGAGTIYYFSLEGIDLGFVAASMESFGISTMLFPFLPPAMYVTLTLLVIAAAVLAAIYPAWKAVHLQPAEAIRIYG